MRFTNPFASGLVMFRRQITLHPRIYLVFQITFLAWSIFWWRFPPEPGKAVLLLGVVAAIVTIQPNMTDNHRLFWLLIVFILFFVEFRAINKDRTEAFARERKARADENAQFALILDAGRRQFETTISEGRKQFDAIVLQNRESMTQAQSQFGQTMARSDRIVAGVVDSIRTQTGGNSIACVKLNMDRPSDPYAYVVVFNRGDYPLQGMTVTIMDDYRRKAALSGVQQVPPEKLSPEKWMQIINSADTVIPVPYLRAHDQQSLGKYVLPQTDTDRISIAFSALNGEWMETLHLRRINGYWVQALSVGSVSMKPFKPTYTYFDKDYPDGSETIKRDWLKTSERPKKTIGQ